MKIIVGLGNAGQSYKNTRHNIGFAALEKFWSSEKNKFNDFKFIKRYKAEISQGKINQEKIILVKPQTYMNLSGQAIKPIMKFYKIRPGDLWVIHDDKDLYLGTIRISRGRGSAGHKGVQNVIDELGSKDFARFRLGVMTPRGEKITAEKFVLKKFSKSELTEVKKIIEKTVSCLETAISLGVEKTMAKYN